MKWLALKQLTFSKEGVQNLPIDPITISLFSTFSRVTNSFFIKSLIDSLTGCLFCFPGLKMA